MWLTVPVLKEGAGLQVIRQSDLGAVGWGRICSSRSAIIWARHPALWPSNDGTMLEPYINEQFTVEGAIT